MPLDFDLIAEATRWTARVSLVLFCAGFVLEHRAALARGAYLGFAGAHWVHLICVVLYFWSLGEPPVLEPVLGILGIGVIVLAIVTRDLLRGRGDGRLAVPWMLWFLWVLLTATHITRLLDPERAGLHNWVLLAICLVAAVARVLLPRR